MRAVQAKRRSNRRPTVVLYNGFALSLWIAAFLVVGAGREAIAQAPGAAGDPEHGKAVIESKCASCHTADGNSTIPQYPKLAAQDPAYLYWQLWAFKTGARKSDVMSGVVSPLSNTDLADAASFYARQPVRPDPVNDQTQASIGERIFLSGGGPAMVPACVMCHGSRTGQGMGPMMGMMGMMGRGMREMNGEGMMGSMMLGNAPSLNGQHAGYIVDQLNRFADGDRQGTVMNRIAAALTEADRKAVGEYLSALP